MNRCPQNVRIFAVTALVMGLSTSVLAVPIVYQQTGVASGILGATAFTNVLVTVTLTGDTSNVTATGVCATCLINLGTTRVNVPGIGTATVTDVTGIVSTVAAFAFGTGFPTVPYVVIGTLDNPPATNDVTGMSFSGSNSFLGYNLRTAIGPIAGSPGGVGYDSCCLMHTTLGNLTFAANFSPTTQGTFTATLVPEPSSLLLLGGGLGAVWLRRRMRLQ